VIQLVPVVDDCERRPRDGSEPLAHLARALGRLDIAWRAPDLTAQRGRIDGELLEEGGLPDPRHAVDVDDHGLRARRREEAADAGPFQRAPDQLHFLMLPRCGPDLARVASIRPELGRRRPQTGD